MRIAIVNDSPIAVECLRRAMDALPGHEVAWVAMDGAEAVARCAADTPDLVLMDIFMPNLDGVETTRRIMAASPCAVVVVTTDVNQSTGKVFEAMSAGALDAVNTPTWGGEGITFLVKKVETIAHLVGGQVSARLRRSPAPAVAPADTGALVAIGASTGGPNALAAILSRMPAELAAAVVVIQHVDVQFASNLATWLGRQSALPVRIAREGDRPEPGTVLLAASNDHLALTAGGTLRYTASPRDYPYRPSVDVFFESVAKYGHPRSAAALLTGMGKDGARGLMRLKEAGWYTLAQDQASCAVYGMPKAAAEVGAARDILPPERIAEAIIRFIGKCAKMEKFGSQEAATGE